MKAISCKVSIPSGSVIEIPKVSSVEAAGYFRQYLTEHLSACSLTSYHFEYLSDSSWVPFNEYVDLSTYTKPDLEDESLEMKIVLEDYDVRTSKLHIKRVREVLLTPPFSLIGISQENETGGPKDSALAVVPESEETPKTSQKGVKLSNAPLALKDEIESQPVNFGNFFHEALYRVGGENVVVPQTNEVDTINPTIRSPSDCILRIQYSGWNPPPATRKLQGDLVYLEVVSSLEGVFHITSTSKGYYVNRSTESLFDPTPAPSPHFSHDLFQTLLSLSPSLRESWKYATQKHDDIDANHSALANIAALFRQGAGDRAMVSTPWIMPPALSNSTAGKNTKGSVMNGITNKKGKASHGLLLTSTHTYDPSRAMEELLDSFGVEDKGAPREWNEEIQSIREMEVTNMAQRTLQAKYLYKTMTEFTEACRLAAMAIIDGHIPPLNPMDPEQSLVYLYNNIFFSRARDNKDSFRLMEGDIAARKSVGQDLKNQRALQQFGVEGLSLSLMTIVDYKGERVVAQGVIPGILTTGERSARLMLGILESGQRMRCKTSVRHLQDKIAKSFRISKRNLPAVPVAPLSSTRACVESVRGEESVAKSDLNGSVKEPLSNGESPVNPDGTTAVTEASEITPPADDQAIQVDDDDEEFPLDALAISHVGPVEGKLLCGSDKRIYALEMVRFTPRDANYVKGSKGTGNIKESALEPLDENLLRTYVIRKELLHSFMQSQLLTLQQDTMLSLLEKQKASLEADDSVASDASKVVTDGSSVTTNESASETSSDVSQEKVKDESKGKTDRSLKLTPEILEAMNSVEVQFEVNPNVFFGFEVDVDPKVAEQDEESARKLANFLWKNVLPSVTEKIRLGESTPIDGFQLVEMMHTNGVNMRYLGQLGRLASNEEKVDEEMLLEHAKRRHPMPLFWLELLQSEMIARCMKHILNDLLRNNALVRAAPLASITAILNYCLGTEDILCGICEEPPVLNGDSTHISNNNHSNQPPTSTHVKTNKKKKGSKKNGHEVGQNVLQASSVVPVIADEGISREQFWTQLRALLLERYDYSLDNMLPSQSAGGGTSFYDRIHRPSLLRRICQIAGVRLLLRDFDFSTPTPFVGDDIQGLVALVSSCEPEPLIPEFSVFLDSMKSNFEEGLLAEALEYGEQGSIFIQQVVGPVHKTTSSIFRSITAMLTRTEDYNNAFAISSRNLAVNVQLHGLDGAETCVNHIELALTYGILGAHSTAIQHLLTARYLLVILGGPKHPVLTRVNLHLAGEYYALKEYELASLCMRNVLALAEKEDQLVYATLCGTAAEYMSHSEDKLNDAVLLHKRGYEHLVQLAGEEHPSTQEAKARLDKIRRQATERAVAVARAKQEADIAERERLLLEDWLDDTNVAHADTKKKSGNGGKSKKNGKKK